MQYVVAVVRADNLVRLAVGRVLIADAFTRSLSLPWAVVVESFCSSFGFTHVDCNYLEQMSCSSK